MTACPVRLGSGTTPTRMLTALRVESLVHGDELTVLQVFDQLGPRSREQRFLTAKPRLTGADLRALTDVDGYDHVALVAREADGRPIGIARFVRDAGDPVTAEVAVTVVDAWQGQGVGTRLAEALTQIARELGIVRISLVMAHDNDAAARLMHRVAGEVTRTGWDNGSVEFEVALELRPRTGRIPGRTLSVLKGAQP
jgi:RimJ/RimL family protein N-acetyltransferase